jgi:cytochrome c553
VRSIPSVMVHGILSVVSVWSALGTVVYGAEGAASDADRKIPAIVPAWVFPLNPLSPLGMHTYDHVKPLHIPDSHVTYTEADLNDLFAAPDWFPASHSAMPRVVALGRAPDVYACGYCHTPAGQGRPENASIAGLPLPYIVQQLADFRSGARRSAWPGSYGPADRMIHAAKFVTVEDATAAAEYFSRQHLKSHVRVAEVLRVPRSQVAGWVYAAEPGGGDELLGERLLEFTPDASRHENRDDGLQYVAYVPIGSLKRGRSIARVGKGEPTYACVSCHGERLQGVGLVPRIAGRSPTYLLRQLLAFKTGARSGSTSQPMLAVISNVGINDMIAVAAYAASLEP